MKSITMIFFLSLIFLIACNKDEFFEIQPESDHEALEGMEETYEKALTYNDSLMFCSIDPNICDEETMSHYDDLFHEFDDMFDIHHGEYSHNNVADDHHHEGDHNVRHGWISHHDDGGHHGGEEEEHHYEHNLETLEMMMELREMHELVHPG